MSFRPPKKPALALDTKLVQDNIPLQIVPRLYIGSIHAAFNQEAMHEMGITHILNCSRMPATFPKLFTYLSIDIRDKEDSNVLACIPAANIFIDAGMAAGGVLVHCIGGRSRSASFIAGFLMSSCGWSFDETYSLLVSVRPVISINRGFEMQLRAYAVNNFDVYGAQQVLVRSRIQALFKIRESRHIVDALTEAHALQVSSSSISSISSSARPRTRSFGLSADSDVKALYNDTGSIKPIVRTPSHANQRHSSPLPTLGDSKEGEHCVGGSTASAAASAAGSEVLLFSAHKRSWGETKYDQSDEEEGGEASYAMDIDSADTGVAIMSTRSVEEGEGVVPSNASLAMYPRIDSEDVDDIQIRQIAAGLLGKNAIASHGLTSPAPLYPPIVADEKTGGASSRGYPAAANYSKAGGFSGGASHLEAQQQQQQQQRQYNHVTASNGSKYSIEADCSQTQLLRANRNISDNCDVVFNSNNSSSSSSNNINNNNPSSSNSGSSGKRSGGAGGGSYTSLLRQFIPLIDAKSPNLRLSRPGSDAIRVIPPLRGLDRGYCCSWCSTGLFSLANVVRIDMINDCGSVGETAAEGKKKLLTFAPLTVAPSAMSNRRNLSLHPGAGFNRPSNLLVESFKCTAFEQEQSWTSATSPTSGSETDTPAVTPRVFGALTDMGPPTPRTSMLSPASSSSDYKGYSEHSIHSSSRHSSRHFPPVAYSVHPNVPSLSLMTAGAKSTAGIMDSFDFGADRMASYAHPPSTMRNRAAKSFDFFDDHAQPPPSLSSSASLASSSVSSLVHTSTVNNNNNNNNNNSSSNSDISSSRHINNKQSRYDFKDAGYSSKYSSGEDQAISGYINYAPVTARGGPDRSNSNSCSNSREQQQQQQSLLFAPRSAEAKEPMISTSTDSGDSGQLSAASTSSATSTSASSSSFLDEYSPRIPIPTHRLHETFTPRERPHSVEKRRWLARVNLLREGRAADEPIDPLDPGDSKLCKLSEDDDEALRQGFGREKYIYLEYLEWMGPACFASGVDFGEINCFSCRKVIGSWIWTPSERQTLAGRLESPLFRIHKHVVQQSDIPLDATPINTPRTPRSTDELP